MSSGFFNVINNFDVYRYVHNRFLRKVTYLNSVVRMDTYTASNTENRTAKGIIVTLF
jgi:hypothetical protein